MITLINLKTQSMPREFVYIGRRMGGLRQSPLHNPYRLSATMNRDQAIAAYRRDLWLSILDDGAAAIELHRLADLYQEKHTLCLACWCAPLPCHGDVVIKAIHWLMEKRLA